MLSGTTKHSTWSTKKACRKPAISLPHFLENCQKQGDLRLKFLDAIIKVLQNTDDLDRFLPNNGPRVQYVASDSVLSLFNDKQARSISPLGNLMGGKQTDLVEEYLEVLLLCERLWTRWRYLRRVADNVESARSCRGRPRCVCGPYFLFQHDERKTRRR